MALHMFRWVVVPSVLAALVAVLGGIGCQANQSPGPRAISQTAATTQSTTIPALTRFEYAQIHMGMRTRLVVYATDENAAVNACRAAFARIADVDRAASDYLIDSELNRVVRTAATQPIKVSDDLWTLFNEALKLSELTDGGFDITVGPLVQLWRKARKDHVLPKKEDIETARTFVGWRKITLDPANHSVRLAQSGMKLDMGGIAKGYAGDRAIETLRAHGINSALCEAGGDIVVGDAPPGKDGWVVGIEDHGLAAPESVAIHNCAISTSGDTEQFVEIAGLRYSHVVDPHTGIGMTTRAMGTVTGPKGLWTDGLSKAVYLVPEDKMDDLLKHYPGTKGWVRKVN